MLDSKSISKSIMHTVDTCQEDLQAKNQFWKLLNFGLRVLKSRLVIFCYDWGICGQKVKCRTLAISSTEGL